MLIFSQMIWDLGEWRMYQTLLNMEKLAETVVCQQLQRQYQSDILY
ncbi:hypothetical protein [Coxiella endosymbiont of Ornithodoros amblus]|nr:hypothetical protein [Coxiella endosymbiont of Ornithodoros amblus]